MRETKAPAKAFLALNLKEEPEFKTKVQEMKKRPKKGQQTSPRVIYVGHLPTGLFEPQLKSYIEQFGNVVRLQLLATTRHTPEEVKEMTGRLLHKEAKLRKRLADKGIHYDFPGFASQVQQKKNLDDTVNASTFLDRRRSMKIQDEDGEIKNTPAQKKSKGKSTQGAESDLDSSSEEEETEEESFLEGSEKPTTCEEPSGDKSQSYRKEHSERMSTPCCLRDNDSIELPCL
uniref:Uncharacterized protein n=1 Tax=Oncorhynchus tshawytscha TaxID=74940 RepID=A0A8C8EHI0_ONCTS